MLYGVSYYPEHKRQDELKWDYVTEPIPTYAGFATEEQAAELLTGIYIGIHWH